MNPHPGIASLPPDAPQNSVSFSCMHRCAWRFAVQFKRKFCYRITGTDRWMEVTDYKDNAFRVKEIKR